MRAIYARIYGVRIAYSDLLWLGEGAGHDRRAMLYAVAAEARSIEFGASRLSGGRKETRSLQAGGDASGGMRRGGPVVVAGLL